MRLPTLLLSILPLLPVALSQSTSGSGYTDYSLNIRDDDDTVIYETASTPANNATFGPPDVFLNASVNVGEINLLVANLSAKVNLDVQVLNLLQFNAGVDLSIGRVNLNIQNVSAFVRLEARLENVVTMINDTLSSVDLNPVLATLGNAVGDLTGAVGGALGGSSNSSTTGSTNSSTTNTNNLNERSLDPFTLVENILYSVNDYSGNTHTNRIFAQNGDLVDQSLDNDGFIYNAQVVGNFASDMTFTGRQREGVIIDGQSTTEKEYAYIPFAGLEVVSHVYFSAGGDVVATRVFVEIEGGGTSTISDDED